MGALEPEIAYLPALVCSDTIAVDVGANKGIYTYALSVLAKHVYCFEPIREHCEYIKRYRTSKVTVVNAALSDFPGRLTLRIPTEGRRRITTRATLVGDDDGGGEGERRVVEVRVMDAYGLENVGFIKIDVEGSEGAVISGAIQTIKRSRPVLLVEMSFSGGERARCEGVFERLSGLDYVPVLIGHGDAHACSMDVLAGDELDRNVVFIPSSHGFLRRVSGAIRAI